LPTGGLGTAANEGRGVTWGMKGRIGASAIWNARLKIEADFPHSSIGRLEKCYTMQVISRNVATRRRLSRADRGNRGSALTLIKALGAKMGYGGPARRDAGA